MRAVNLATASGHPADARLPSAESRPWRERAAAFIDGFSAMVTRVYMTEEERSTVGSTVDRMRIVEDVLSAIRLTWLTPSWFWGSTWRTITCRPCSGCFPVALRRPRSYTSSPPSWLARWIHDGYWFCPLRRPWCGCGPVGTSDRRLISSLACASRCRHHHLEYA